jgi:hypothetical protein
VTPRSPRIKRLDVLSGTEHVAGGYLVMPHRSSWGGSTFVRATLRRGTRYTIRIGHDDNAVNMSGLARFADYKDTGGASGPFTRVSISELKVLWMR